MKKIKNKLIILILVLILLQITIFTDSKYATKISSNGQAYIASPIAVLESFENESLEITKLSLPREYIFKLKNYNDEKINEVDFLYNLEIISSTEDFPIEYKLIDLSTKEEVTLENNKSNYFKLQKAKKEEKLYKLIINWKEKPIKLADLVDLNIKVNLKQYKIGEF